VEVQLQPHPAPPPEVRAVGSKHDDAALACKVFREVPEDAGFPDACIPSYVDVSAFLKALPQLADVFLSTQAHAGDLDFYVLKCLTRELFEPLESLMVPPHRREWKAACKVRQKLVPSSISAAGCDFDRSLDKRPPQFGSSMFIAWKQDTDGTLFRQVLGSGRLCRKVKDQNVEAAEKLPDCLIVGGRSIGVQVIAKCRHKDAHRLTRDVGLRETVVEAGCVTQFSRPGQNVLIRTIDLL